MANRYQREFPDAVRPATAWRRANFREAAWRRLTGITVSDTCTLWDMTFNDDTIADRKRAKLRLTPGERRRPPFPDSRTRYEPDIRHRLMIRRARRSDVTVTEHDPSRDP